MPNRRFPSLACTALAALGCSFALVALPACNEKALELPPDAGAVPEGLTAEQAAAVVAKVGDHTITLGDVAAHIGSLNPYYRLRFQSKELRRKLVDEMIDVELLAIEARRLGLDKDPRTEEAIRQVLRDAMLAEARKDVPDPSAFSAAEVRAYYEANRDRFREPERRRVAAIVLAKREDAEKVLAQALEDKSAEAWGKLYLASSETAPPKPGAQTPAELQGDLGIVGPPGDAKAANPKIPEAVQRAVFTLTDVPTVHGEVVLADGKFFVVRLVGRTAGYTRNLEESDKNIRIILRQERVRAREEAMFEDLRKRFPIEIDEQALKSVPIPEAVDRVDAYWERDGGARAEPPDAGP